MPIQPKHLDPNGILRRKCRRQEINTIENNVCYRGTGGIGVTMGAIVVGTVILMGTAGAGAASFPVHGEQSLLFTGDNWANAGVGDVKITFTITGYDLDGVPLTEDLQVTGAAAGVVTTPISVVSLNIFSYVTSVVVKSIDLFNGAALDAAPLLAIGHGVSTIASATGRMRFPVSAKVKTVGEIIGFVDPNAQPVAFSAATLDVTRHTLANASGTTFVAGRYVVIYHPSFNEQT
jgi:hypothetical protein